MTYEEWLAHKSTEFDESKVKRDSRGRFAPKSSSEKVRIKTEDGREIEGEYVSLDNAKRMKLYQGPKGTYTTDINRGVSLSQRTERTIGAGIPEWLDKKAR